MCHISLAHCWESAAVRPAQTCGSSRSAIASWYSPCLARCSNFSPFSLMSTETRTHAVSTIKIRRQSCVVGAARLGKGGHNGVFDIGELIIPWITRPCQPRVAPYLALRTQHIPSYALNSVYAPLFGFRDHLILGI